APALRLLPVRRRTARVRGTAPVHDGGAAGDRGNPQPLPARAARPTADHPAADLDPAPAGGPVHDTRAGGPRVTSHQFSPTPPYASQDGLELGRCSALAVACARDLIGHARRYEGLFPGRAFDQGFFLALGLVGAFGSPWATAAELRVTGRASLWVFAVDRLIDHVASSRAEAAALAADCLAVADGAAPRQPVTLFLAELRDEVAAGTSVDAWRDQLGRMLTAMIREWDWRSGERPSLDGYLDNADSNG